MADNDAPNRKLLLPGSTQDQLAAAPLVEREIRMVGKRVRVGDGVNPQGYEFATGAEVDQAVQEVLATSGALSDSVAALGRVAEEIGAGSGVIVYENNAFSVADKDEFRGNTGPANSTFTTKAALTAAPVSNGSYIFAPPSGADSGTAAGTFTYQTAGAPYTADGANIIKLDAVPLSTGALVRQGADGITFRAFPAEAVTRTAQDKAREIVSVLDFGAKGDGVTDDTAAFNAAIATGKTVSVPHSTAGYSVANVDVRDNMQVVGEKNGMANAPKLIVRASGASAFRNGTGNNVFHCVFENLACDVAPGVTNASFYSQSTQTKYSAYFVFRNVETYLSLRASYRGLFIFAIWDNCRDGYSGSPSDTEHSFVVALAESYGQTNQQNINRVRDSKVFGSFGGQAAVVMSYGIMFTFDNTDFEKLKVPAFRAYNVFQIHFNDCWFERIDAGSMVHLGNYPGTVAASHALFNHCQFAMIGTALLVVMVEEFGTTAFRKNTFNIVPAGALLCNDGTRVTINEDNYAVTGPGVAGFYAGTHHDSYSGGRRMLNGASDNAVPGMTLQNLGGVTASAGFLSDDNIAVGTDFVTVAKSATGLGGTVVISGFDPGNDGLQFRVVKDWHSNTVRDVAPLLNNSPKIFTFQATSEGLQMKVDSGSVVVFTTLLN